MENTKTLRDFYFSLPEKSNPKSEFVTLIAYKARVTPSAVKHWIFSGKKPSNEQHIEIISKVTGISKENLWK